MKRTVTYFIVKDLPFETILANEVLEPERQEVRTGKAAAWEVLAAPSLRLELECPFCGQAFTLDYYRDEIEDNHSSCPHCGERGALGGGEVRDVFENRLRQSLSLMNEDDEEELSRLGRLIALAAILLEPLCLVFVVGFWSDRIGHFLLNSQMLWLRSRSFARDQEPLLIAFPPHPDRESNHYVTELWARSGRYLISPAALPAYDLLSRKLTGHNLDNPAVNLPTMFWGLKYRPSFGPDDTPLEVISYNPKPRQARHLIDLREYYWTFDPDLSLMKSSPPFAFTPEEDRAAAHWLEEHGLPRDYVTFLGRDQAYVEAKASHYDPAQYEFRNMDIDKCVPAMSWVADQGLGVLRMGFVVKGRLGLERPGLVDYANLDRSEFLDVYFSAHCRYSICSTSGLVLVPYLFKRPVAGINIAFESPLFQAGAPSNVHLSFKNIWSEKQGRLLSIRDILALKADQWFIAERYQEAGLSFIEHSPEELLAITREMHSRYVTGDWEVTDDELQTRAKYVKLLSEFYPGVKVGYQLSYSSFKANPHLLADA